MLAPLIAMTAFDLAQGDLATFAAYRFLYERIVGVDFRPWLVPAFCGAATFPSLRGDRRIALLRTIDEEEAVANAGRATGPASCRSGSSPSSPELRIFFAVNSTLVGTAVTAIQARELCVVGWPEVGH